MERLQVFLGHDKREEDAFQVATASLKANASVPVEVRAVVRSWLQHRRMYQRPTETRDGRLWDVVSDAPMSTEHAIARFFVPMICGYHGWALFADCDILVRNDIAKLFALADDRYAVMVVQHTHEPPKEREPASPTRAEMLKMDGQIQTFYQRKNWSSVALWNCAHPAHRDRLTVDVLNTWPGRDLHAFKWLEDTEIGRLPQEWNYLVGVTHPRPDRVSIAHYTLGHPSMPGYEHCEFSEEWWAVASSLRIPVPETVRIA